MIGKLPSPGGHAPLIALPVLVLDFETTGLDVRSDRVVQVGALAMEGARFLEGDSLDLLVDPGMPMPAASEKVHGISDKMLEGAEGFTDIAPRLLALLAGRVVVGHHIAFDLAVLRHEAGRAQLPWREPPALDIGHLAGALFPELPDLGLETLASFLEVEVEARHSAMGDCLTTAGLWKALLDHLLARDVRTLAQAQSFAQRRQDLLLRETEAGWHSRPGQAREEAGPEGRPRIDPYVFEGRLGDHMSKPVHFIESGAKLREAARMMSEMRIGALLVGSAGAPPEGIITERDLLRVAADADRYFDSLTVASAMSSPVETMKEGALLYQALGRMDRLDIRHLCVVDDAGLPLGMISQRDLLDHRARSSVMLEDALQTAEDLQALAAAYGRVPDVAALLAAEGTDGRQAARFVSQELCALTARAAALSLAKLRANGKGSPPGSWCLVVLGSGGREESLLGADQDNALIHDGGEEADAWFEEMGKELAQMLDACGVPLCKGGVMAKNPAWRGSETFWRERVGGWLAKAHPKDLLNVDIFFDLVPVAGRLEMAWALRKEAVERASETPAFLGLMAQSVQGVSPRLSLFGKVHSEEGRVDLKRDGLLPLVSLARSLALRAGSTERTTPERLQAAARAAILPEGDAEGLIELHERLLTLVLRQQLSDLEQGLRPTGKVIWKDLGSLEKRDLTAGLKRLNAVIGDIHGYLAH
jgi:DNA polymerase-3 subunit epsilon/CBS domain-containing protein